MDNKDNEKKAKKFILRGINVIICVGGFLLFSFVCLIFYILTHTYDIHINSYGNASPEELREARKMLNAYGRSLQDAVQSYKEEHSNELPTIENILSTVDNPNNISCESNTINYDGSVYLKTCKVGPKVINLDFGEERLDPTDSKNCTHIYIYKYNSERKNDNGVLVKGYYYYSETEKRSDFELVDTYECKVRGCSALDSAFLTDLSTKDANRVILKDDNVYYFYNILTKSKEEITNLNLTGDKIQSMSMISDSMGNITYLFIKRLDGKGAFFNVPSKTYTSDFIFTSHTTSTSLLDGGLLVGTISDENGKSSLTLFSSYTGDYVGTYEGVEFANSFLIQDSNGTYHRFYFLFNPVVGGTIGSSGYLLRRDSTTTLATNISDGEKVYYRINNDNTITLCDSTLTSFRTIDYYGNVKYKSSTFTSIDNFFSNYIVVRNNKEVLILDQYGKTISKFFDTADNYKYHSFYMGITTLNGLKAIHYEIEDSNIAEGVDGHIINYYYVLDTGEIKKTTQASVPPHD